MSLIQFPEQFQGTLGLDLSDLGKLSVSPGPGVVVIQFHEVRIQNAQGIQRSRDILLVGQCDMDIVIGMPACLHIGPQCQFIVCSF